MDMLLNGFNVTFSSPTFTANTLDLPDPEAVAGLRKTYELDWFLYWRNGTLFGIQKVATPSTVFGIPDKLQWTEHDHLHLLVARLNDKLPEKFPEWEAFRHRPFAFIGRKGEIVSDVTSQWSGLSPLVGLFKIRPTFELDPRIIELRDGEVRVGLFMAVETKWDIFAPLNDLVAAGIEVAGLHVVRRNPAPEQRRLVGTIERVVGDRVDLSEAYEGLKSVPVNDVWLEGRRDSFNRCLRHLMGSRIAEFEEKRRAAESKLLTAPAVHDLLSKMQEYLWNASPLELTADLSCSIRGVITLQDTGTYRTVVRSKPSDYCFDGAKAKRSDYAWPGLERYGPFDRDSFAKRTPRILVVCPDKAEGQVGQFIKMFRDGIFSLSGSRYANGLAGNFGLVNPQFVTCSVPLLGAGNQPAAELYRKTVEEHLSRNPPYDAAFTVILDEHAYLPDGVNPYLYAKGMLLMAGVPVQEARLSTITQRPKNLQYTMQNLAVALYAKLGGVPWTVAQDLTVDDEIVVGMGTAELSGSRFEQRQRHIGITTVFRGDGNYLLSNLSRECAYEEYPTVLRDSMLSVLAEIKQRNGWRASETVRVVFHAAKRLRNVEVAEIVAACVQEVGRDQNVQFAFLTVNTDHPFRIIDPTQRGISMWDGQLKGRMAPERGIVAQLGKFTRLATTNGPRLMKSPNSPLPSPLLIHLHPQSTYVDQTYLSDQALKFTSLSWRSVLPAQRPVTIYYSELIAELLARLRQVPGWSPMALNAKLRGSKWFL